MARPPALPPKYITPFCHISTARVACSRVKVIHWWTFTFNTMDHVVLGNNNLVNLGLSPLPGCQWQMKVYRKHPSIYRVSSQVQDLVPIILLMEEIPNNQLGSTKPCKTFGYLPYQLVQPDFWTINRITQWWLSKPFFPNKKSWNRYFAQIQGCRFGPEKFAARPWFHQYLDPNRYHLWRIVSEYVFRGQICNLRISLYWPNK